MFILVYFQGQLSHTLTMVYFHGRLAHIYSLWSIFKGDLPFWLGLPKIPSGNLELKSVFFLLARFELAKSVSLTRIGLFFKNKFPNGRVLLIFLSVPRSQQWFSFIISSMIFFSLFFFPFVLFCFVVVFFFKDFPVTNKNMCAMLWG